MYSGLRWDACSIKMYRVFRKIWYILLKSSKMQEYRNTMIFEKKKTSIGVFLLYMGPWGKNLDETVG